MRKFSRYYLLLANLIIIAYIVLDFFSKKAIIPFKELPFSIILATILFQGMLLKIEFFGVGRDERNLSKKDFFRVLWTLILIIVLGTLFYWSLGFKLAVYI